MKAAYIERLGPPEAVRFGDLPAPSVGPHDVLLKVTAVCVNPIDCNVRNGRFPVNMPFPFILGRDAVGLVEQTGSEVTRFKAGDRAWTNNQGYHGRQGTFAEQISVREDLLYPLPADAIDNAVVAFIQSGLTAFIGLERVAIQKGETLFLNGGSGSVGSAVLQIAHARGIRVIATAGDDRGLEWCRSLGADKVINYKSATIEQETKELAPDGVDVYWDTSDLPDFDQAVGRLARHGRIVVMSGLNARPPFPVRPFYLKECSMVGFALTYVSEAKLGEVANEINRWIASGKMRVRIDRVVPLKQTAAAHRVVEERAHLNGKIVLHP